MPILNHEDTRRLIEDLRYLVLRPSGHVPREQIAEQAAIYAEVCEEVNTRLRKCCELLERGLRTEAIEMAEENPPVLDEVAMLDFPELSEWHAILTQKGIVHPPGILIELATHLNQAYSDNLQLDDLLRMHRLYALSRAPLSKRIDVLRKMLAKDPNNPAWQDDMQAWDRERFRQIQTEVVDAAKNSKLDKLVDLVKELQSEEWSTNPPPEVCALAQKHLQRIQREYAIKSLEALAPQMEQTFVMMDTPMLRALAEAWERNADVAMLSTNDPLAERVAHVFDWIENDNRRIKHEQNHQYFLRIVDAALANKMTTVEELERHCDQGHRFGYEIPEELASRINAFVALDRRRKSQRFRKYVAYSLVCLLVVVGGIAYGAARIIHSEQVTVAKNSLKQLLDTNKRTEAREYLDQLVAQKPSVANDAELTELTVQLTNYEASEKQRVTKLGELWLMIEKAGVAKPNGSAIKDAEKLSKSNQEKARLRGWKDKVADESNRTQDELDAKAKVQIPELRVMVDALSKISFEDDVQTANVEYDRAASKIRTVVESSRASQVFLDQIKDLEEKTRAMKEGHFQYAQYKKASERIAANSDNLDEFISGLKGFVIDFPKANCCNDFTLVAKNMESYTFADAFYNVFDPAAVKNWNQIDPKDVKLMIRKGDDLVANSPQHASAKLYSSLKPLLSAISERENEQGKPILDDLKSIFRDDMILNVYVLQHKDGKRYYLDELNGRRVVRDFDVEKRAEINFSYLTSERKSKKMSLRAENIEFCNLARHSQAAVELLGINNGGWEQTMAEIITKLEDNVFKVEKGKEMDPIVAVIMLKNAIETACRGSYALTKHYHDKLSKLNQGDLDVTVAWMMPDDGNANNHRAKARAILADYKNVVSGEFSTQSTQVQFHKRLGLLVKNSKGEWSWKCSQFPSHDVRLFALQKKDEAESDWSDIGSYEKNAINLSPTISVPEGSPVYILPK